MKQMIRKGDILYIHSLDRFSRNVIKKKSYWGNAITKEIEADIVVLNMSLLGTTQYYSHKHKENTWTNCFLCICHENLFFIKKANYLFKIMLL